MTWVSMSIIIYSYYIYSPFQNGQKINLTYDIIYYINMSKNSSGVTLARTLKWLDKTGIQNDIQRGGINFVRPSSMHVVTLNSNISKMGIKIKPKRLLLCLRL